ncbi:MAG TPA: MFS transporter [Actinomycetes bacterium]
MTGLGRRGAATLALLCVAQFVDVLGVTIVVVALPSIQRELGFSPAGLQWVVSTYALLFGGFLMLSGRAADLYGRRRLFMTGLALFGLASLACGLARSPAWLVVARAAQGLGAALVVPAALSILTTTFSAAGVRNRALGIWTAAAAGGGAAGFVLGGVLTQGLGWRWVFLVNLPVIALGLVVAPALIRESRDPAASARLDVLGAVTVTGGLIALIYGLTHAEDAGFASVVTIAAVAVAVILLAAFPLVERRVAEPLAPPAVFRSPELVGSNLVAFTLTAVTSSAGLLATLYLQQVLDYSPSATGLALLPFSLAVIVGSFAGGWLVGRIAARNTMLAGLVAVAAAMLLVTAISAGGGVVWLVAGVSLAGAGLGCASVAATATGTAAVSADRQGLASGLLNTAAQIGTAIGIAALATLAAARTRALAGTAGPSAAQLVAGFRLAFLVAAALSLAGCLAAVLLVQHRGGRQRAGVG